MPIEPMSSPKPPANGRTVAIVGAASAAALFALVSQWEGKENVGYRDIVGVPTACYGDTQNVTVGQHYSNDECVIRLDRQVAAHAAPVLACVPKLAEPAHRNQLVASVSLAYNIGPRGFCGSTAARRFNAGDWVGGCDAFLRWNKAGGREVRGLTNRRRFEHDICVRGLGA